MKFIVFLVFLVSFLEVLKGDPGFLKNKENLGTLKVGPLFFQTSLELYEGDSESNDLTNLDTSLSFSWEIDTGVSAVARLGSKSFLKIPQYYYKAEETFSNFSIGFYEAYFQYINKYGQFQVGRIPLGYGLQSYLTEETFMFSRPLLFSKNIVALRDMGFSYRISQDYYFAQVVLHNGEVSSNKDNYVWLTSTWGWHNDYGVIGLMGQVGKTGLESSCQRLEKTTAKKEEKSEQEEENLEDLEDLEKNLNKKEYFYSEYKPKNTEESEGNDGEGNSREGENTGSSNGESSNGVEGVSAYNIICSGSTLGGFDSKKKAEWKIGGIFYHYNYKNFKTAFEASFGEMSQSLNKNEFYLWHLDFLYRLDNIGFHLRYDNLEPNVNLENDELVEITFGFSIKSEYNNSIFSVFGVRVKEEGEDIANDRLQIGWKIHPNGFF